MNVTLCDCCLRIDLSLDRLCCVFDCVYKLFVNCFAVVAVLC